ncbi:LytR C-terminal domain-containing protein [Saccharopolyspora cebuensis]|uniref:LytR C-terminal domain-containing protein n=1 Tax=Saccharopolyspora cebuensis TaxID=418759 RepID=A0ABV4CN45_9PSEU
MTSAEPPTGPSRNAIAGYGLIGAGAVAAVIGVVTLASGGQAENSAQPPRPAAATSSPEADPPAPPPPEDPAAEDPPADEPPTSSAAQQPPAPPQRPPETIAPPPQSQPRILVRVYNNSTIEGLAQRAADDLLTAGYEVPDVGNYARGIVPTTTVYYREGTGEKAQAEEIARALGARVAPRFDGIQDATPGLIAIITNDYQGGITGK